MKYNNNGKTLLLALGILCASTLFTNSAVADGGQSEGTSKWKETSGWHLGIHFLSNNIGTERPVSENAFAVEEDGGGGSLFIGYDFTPVFGLRLAFANARHETNFVNNEVDHASATLEAHFRFNEGRQTRPYLFGGIGGASLINAAEPIETEVTGGVAVLGGGVQYQFSRRFSLDFGARLDMINWNEVRVTAEGNNGDRIELSDPVEEDGSAFKLMLGLVWHL
ncbi:MAG: outer membrane beta-barrel protein [Candidatus Eisenbacteria bacterium]|uniref:Outer membrane beta-barrel protein n=1 Tax=Eiseniibacteriota bacterium TaxID=2212470 RepID=A0A7Y2EE30_UNCEI|nr:outer membrane beta-barrel protein [Candidatus Eisenbacteria bacterium]